MNVTSERPRAGTAIGTSVTDSLSGSRVFVAGHRGLVGSAVVRALEARTDVAVATRSRAELDLADVGAVREYLQAERPDVVFLCAARVGGILANATYPAEFVQCNLAIQTNVIHEAWRAGTRRLIFLGSSCIYPRDCPQPIREEYLLSGPLEATNRSYAIAKIAGIEMCWAYNRQYDTRYVALMPANLYGPGDNYDLETSHVLPALIRKFHEGKASGAGKVSVWGSGTPRRELMHSDDMAAAALHVAGLGEERLAALHGDEAPPLLNVGTGKDITVAELAALIRDVVGFEGEVVWDRTRPDGTPRKLLDIGRIRALGWAPRIGLRDGVRQAYADYLGRSAGQTL